MVNFTNQLKLSKNNLFLRKKFYTHEKKLSHKRHSA